MLSANSQDYSDESIIAATEWALDNGANIVSNSWGTDTGLQMGSMDRYLDHLVWVHRLTVVTAAGNFGLTGNVWSPGLGYNMITVGAFDDMDDSSWSNDVMAWYSSFKNPISTHNDRQKPEVVAVGSRIETTIHTTPWIGRVSDGTSLAAPAVAAEAALLMQANSWLKTSPEAVKAIIMASAVHNIEGDSRLSDKDGAGGIDISSAYNKTNASEMILFAFDFPKNITFSSSAGEKVRVVIVWDSHPDSNHPPVNDDLQSDLDLYIYDPSGAWVNKSDSYDNSYEIVEFTAPATGTYNAQIYAPTFNGLYEYVGIAKTALPSLSGWNYAKVKTITGTTAGAQTNYQMKLTVYKGNGTDSPGTIYLGGNVKDDFGDLRFTKSDGVTLLDYWIESCTSGVSAVVWVEVDSIPASTANIYLYYGNSAASSASNGDKTFIFFDDFPGTTLDTSKWTISGTGYSVSGGELAVTAGVNDTTLSGKVLTSYPAIKEAKIRTSAATINLIQYIYLVNNLYVNDAGGYGVPIANSIRTYTRSNGYITGTHDNPVADLTASHIYKLVWTPSEIRFYQDSTNFRTYTSNIATVNMGDHYASYSIGYGTAYVDWTRLRNYASPEPAWG